MIVWSAAEISVTMVCIGIPICRPLYKTFLEQLISQITQGSSYQNAESGEHHQFAMHTFGGSTLKPRPTPFGSGDHVESGGQDCYADPCMGLRTATKIFTVSVGRRAEEEASDEEALNHAYCGVDQNHPKIDASRQGIKVTEEYCVTSSSRC